MIEIQIDKHTDKVCIIAHLTRDNGSEGRTRTLDDSADSYVRISEIREAKEDRLNGVAVSERNGNGRWRQNHAHFGVTVEAIPDVLAAQFPGLLNKRQGLLITKVAAGSPAAGAGLRPNMVLLSLSGVDLDSINHLQKLMAQSKIGERVTVELLTGGKVKRVKLSLAESRSA